jgi:hypothetical protein
MAIQQTATYSFAAQLPVGTHVFGTDVLKMALYISTATLNADTTAYTASGEVSATGYTAGGATLTGVAVTSSDGVACITFAAPVWTAALTARGALIYNSSKANAAIAVLDFGGDKTSTTTFTVTPPAATSTSAVIRIRVGNI